MRIQQPTVTKTVGTARRTAVARPTTTVKATGGGTAGKAFADYQARAKAAKSRAQTSGVTEQQRLAAEKEAIFKEQSDREMATLEKAKQTAANYWQQFQTYLQNKRDAAMRNSYGQPNVAGANYISQQQAAAYAESQGVPDIYGGKNYRNEADYSWLPADYRERYASMLMTPQEYAMRSSTWKKQYQPGYNEWIQSAQATPNQGHWIGSEWSNANPEPAGFLQTYEEWTRRQRAAPPGYMVQPFGSGFAKLATVPSVPPSAEETNTGGGGGWGYPYYGGGGGGYDWTPAPDINRWMIDMMNWNINQPQGG